jgi:hypothetical protein
MPRRRFPLALSHRVRVLWLVAVALAVAMIVTRLV